MCTFMERIIGQLRSLGRERSAEAYTTALRSFRTFCSGADIALGTLSSDTMQAYEAHLRSRGVSMNTISFYMRILRAVYNRAVEQGHTRQLYPFRHVYTGIDKTVKRAVPIGTVRAIRDIDLTARPALEFARDMFLFSFYTRGMSFIDMAYLRKADVQNGILVYRRRKTGQRLSIRWEGCMQQIATKYTPQANDYLLPIIRTSDNERLQYTNAQHLINHHLHALGRMLRLPAPLSMYVARHSWASAAKAKHIPLSVISQGMGHDSEATTRIYLASLETSVIDRANRKILDSL